MGQKVNSSIFRLGLKTTEWKYKYIEKNPEESSRFLYKNIEIKNYINNIFKRYNILLNSCKIEYTQTAVNVIVSFYELKSQTKTFYLKHQNNKDFFKHPKNGKELISFLITQVINVSLSLYVKNKIINIKVKDLNKTFESNIRTTKHHFNEYKKLVKHLRRFLRNPVQKDFIKILFIGVFNKNSSKLVADAIATFITKNKKQHNYLMYILKRTINKLINSPFSQIKGIKIIISGRFNGVPRSKKKSLKIGVIPLQSFNSKIDYHQSVAYTPNGTFGIKVWICEK